LTEVLAAIPFDAKATVRWFSLRELRSAQKEREATLARIRP
jgi:hypothetical protein